MSPRRSRDPPSARCHASDAVIARAQVSMFTFAAPVPSAGSAMERWPSSSARSSARHIARPMHEVSFHALTAWITWRAARVPALVAMHAPSGCRPPWSASSSIASPPRRRSASPTPLRIRSS